MTNATIAVCTHSRARSLERLLSSLCALDRRPALALEILVVDNASTDDTAAVVESFADRLPVRRVTESRLGISYARNKVLDCAAGELVLCTDDDVTVPPDWLVKYVDAFDLYPEASFLAGPISAQAPGVSAHRLDAFRRLAPGVLSHLEPDIGLTCLYRPDGLIPWGANFAYRNNAVRGVAYDTNLGRKPDNRLGSHEETTFLKNLIEQGKHGIWLPHNPVDHNVTAERMKMDYVRRYYKGIGRGLGYLASARENDAGEATLARLRQQLRESRRAHRFVGPWSPLERRLAAIRDIFHLRSMIASYEDAANAKLAAKTGKASRG